MEDLSKRDNIRPKDKDEKLIKALLLYCMEEEYALDEEECAYIPLTPEGRKKIKKLLTGWLGEERAETLLLKIESGGDGD